MTVSNSEFTLDTNRIDHYKFDSDFEQDGDVVDHEPEIGVIDVSILKILFDNGSEMTVKGPSATSMESDLFKVVPQLKME